MVNIRGRGSPKAGEVGEIDTAAPFQSVKAAVSLFGAVATLKGKASFPSFKRQPSTVENGRGSAHCKASDKETRLMLAGKDLARYKMKLESADATKALALSALEEARRTLEELNIKIMTVNDSTHTLFEATEAVRQQALKLEEDLSREDITADGPWHEELEQAGEHYLLVSSELYSTKRSLANIRQDIDVALEAKQAAYQLASQEKCTSKAHRDKAAELRKEIASMHESIEHLKSETQRSSKAHGKSVAERESLLQSHRPAKEETERKIKGLKQQFNPELTRILEQQYAETTAEIQQVKEQMMMAHGSEMTSVRDITDDLNKATKTWQNVSAEESDLRARVASLGKELEDVHKECAQAEENEERMERLAATLQEQLERCKAELIGLTEFHTDELFSKLHRLLSGINNDKRAVEEIGKNVDGLKKETESAQNTKEEAEKQLQDAVAELEIAKAGAKQATEELRNVSTVCATDFGPGGAKIRMSKKDYETLDRKQKEADNLAEMKVAAVMFQLGAISAKKNEADVQVDNTLKEIERMQAVIDFALKQADASGSAQKMIESELEKWNKQK